MRRLALALAALTSLSTGPAAAAEKERRSFAPASDWVMEYGDESCRLIRNFSDDEGAVTLAFERFDINPEIRLGLTGSTLRVWSNASKATFRYGPGGKDREQEMLRTHLEGGNEGFLISGASLLAPEQLLAITDSLQGASRADALNREEAAAATRAQSVIITEGFKSEIDIQLGSMAAPIRALHDCAIDLVKSWGLDPAKVVSMSRLPEPINSTRGWVIWADYPADAARSGDSGVVDLRLIIGPEGTVEGCRFQLKATGAFEKVACDAISRRARFSPALDAEGNPMRAYWRQRIVFSY